MLLLCLVLFLTAEILDLVYFRVVGFSAMFYDSFLFEYYLFDIELEDHPVLSAIARKTYLTMLSY